MLEAWFLVTTLAAHKLTALHVYKKEMYKIRIMTLENIWNLWKNIRMKGGKIEKFLQQKHKSKMGSPAI